MIVIDYILSFPRNMNLLLIVFCSVCPIGQLQVSVLQYLLHQNYRLRSQGRLLKRYFMSSFHKSCFHVLSFLHCDIIDEIPVWFSFALYGKKNLGQCYL
jgi:hypothetical protein